MAVPPASGRIHIGRGKFVRGPKIGQWAKRRENIPPSISSSPLGLLGVSLEAHDYKTLGVGAVCALSVSLLYR